MTKKLITVKVPRKSVFASKNAKQAASVLVKLTKQGTKHVR